MTQELPVIQKVYDLVLWYVPIANRLPRDHKQMLGERIISGLYELLEELVLARYSKEKLARLERQNSKLNVLRYQTRLLLDLNLISPQRYEYAIQLIDNIGIELGGWIKQQRQPQKRHETSR